jgi:hypothetical protein
MKDDSYLTMTSSFVERAENLLARGKKADLLYAALEVRMGIEARLQSYVHAHKDISKKIKNGWEIKRLAKALDEKGSWTQRVCEIELLFQVDGSSMAKLYFIPISSELKAIGAQLGDFLHYRESSVSRNAAWWERLRTTLDDGIRELRVCAQANFLGPPLFRKDDPNTVDMKIEFHPDDPRHSLLLDLSQKKSEFTLKVNYIPVAEFYRINR